MKKAQLAPVCGLLVASGACALIYQVAWLRELRLVFGCTTLASAAVVAIFMGGLGIGNALLARRADAKTNPLAFYAWLEAGIALSALISPWLIDAIRWGYIELGGQMTLGWGGATLVRLLLSALILLLPTILMGGTLAAAIAAVTTAQDEHRRAPAILYGVNTLGAVAGAMLSTFVLLPVLGTRMTLWCACALNVVAVAGAFLLSRREGEGPSPVPQASPSKPRPRQAQQLAPAPINPVPILAAAGIVGFAFMLMELVWYRMLASILGGTTYTFGLILSVALLGIGIGGTLYPLFFRKRQPDMLALSATCGLEALCFAIPFALGDRLAVAQAVLHEGNTAGFPGEVLGWTLIAAAVVLPASIVSGVQFPVLIGMLGQGDKNVGRQVGWTYFYNTMGGILGSLAGGMGLLPLLSAPGAWRLVVVTVAGLSIYLAWASERRRWKWSAPALSGLGLAAILLLLFPGPTAVWRHSGIGGGRGALPTVRTANAMRAWENQRQRQLLWEADGMEAGVGIIGTDDLAFVVNGKSDGSAILDAGMQTGSGLLATLLHPNPKTCFVVGLGTGETAGWVAQVPSIERVDVAEIEPVILEMARRCSSVNAGALENPKVQIIFNDARELLLTTDQSYDLVVSEPSNPYRAGVASLFTREYYQAVQQRLNPQGLFVQWLQAYETDDTTVHEVLATVRSVFPHVEIWQSLHYDMLLICSREPFAYQSEMLHQRLGQEPYRTTFGQVWRVSHIEEFLARFVAGQELVDQIASETAGLLNTDDLNRIEYGFARTLGRVGQFSIAAFRQRAVALGAGRPTNLIEGVDWDAVEDERQAVFIPYLQANLASPQKHTPEFLARAEALKRSQFGDYAGVAAHWETQPRAPRSQTEIEVLARAYAALGNAKAGPLLDRLRSLSPREADLLRGVLLVRQGRKKEATEPLIAGLIGLRKDPWVQWEIVQEATRAACEVARDDPACAGKFLNALKEPFPAGFVDDMRHGIALFMASLISPQEAVPWIESFEPYYPWSRPLLTKRAEVYAAVGHPLAARARAELELFSRQEVLSSSTQNAP